MCSIFGSDDVCSDDVGTSNGICAPLVKQINLVGALCSNLVLERYFISATVAEISEELEKVDVPIWNHCSCRRHTEEGTNGEGLEDYWEGHRDDSAVLL